MRTRCGVTILIAVALVASQAHAQPQQPKKPGCRSVSLNPDVLTHQEEIRGAPFTLTALVFPEPFTKVSCANCTDKAGAQPENWFMQLAPAERTVLLKPTRLPDATHPLAAFNTTVHITLEGGYRININLGLADLYGATPPDAEVAFVLSAKATMAGRLAEEVGKLEAEFKQRVEAESKDRFLEYLLGEIHCESASGRPYVTDKLYLRVQQTCVAEAAPPTHWVVFEVTNRGNLKVDLGTALLSDGATAADDSQHAFRFEKSSLRFGERTRGIALLVLAPDQPAPSAWALEVFEQGGAERRLLAPDLEF